MDARGSLTAASDVVVGAGFEHASRTRHGMTDRFTWMIASYHRDRCIDPRGSTRPSRGRVHPPRGLDGPVLQDRCIDPPEPTRPSRRIDASIHPDRRVLPGDGRTDPRGSTRPTRSCVSSKSPSEQKRQRGVHECASLRLPRGRKSSLPGCGPFWSARNGERTRWMRAVDDAAAPTRNSATGPCPLRSPSPTATRLGLPGRSLLLPHGCSIGRISGWKQGRGERFLLRVTLAFGRGPLPPTRARNGNPSSCGLAWSSHARP